MVIIVDGQNVGGIISYLILQEGVDFRNIVKAAFFYKENLYIRQARVVYRDTIKGRQKLRETVERHNALVNALKSQGIEVMDAPDGTRKTPRKNYNLDSLIKNDLNQAINDPTTRMIVLLSGDDDFAPYIQMAHEKGIKFVVIGNDGSISPRLEDRADQTYRLQNLLPILARQV